MDLIKSSDFFQILRSSTIEGAYADPLYGGNKNMEGWKMKEYPGAQLSYRNLMTEDYQAGAEYVVIEPMSLSDQ
jgi:gluconate 2-dehydrogenase gamma chain